MLPGEVDIQTNPCQPPLEKGGLAKILQWFQALTDDLQIRHLEDDETMILGLLARYAAIVLPSSPILEIRNRCDSLNFQPPKKVLPC